MKKLFWTFIAVTAVLALAVMVVRPDWLVILPKASAITNPKGDDPCTGHEIVGRCADKCPNSTDKLIGFDPVYYTAICQSACPAPTAEGAYYPQGNSSTGGTVCGFSYYHECPYVVGQPADSPTCKAPATPTAAPQPVPPAQPKPAATFTPDYSFEGK